MLRRVVLVGEVTRFPPLPPIKVDIDTEPGLGLLAVKQENKRLRMERDEARQERDSLRASITILPPPPSKRVKNLLAGGKYATLIPVVVLVAGVAERQWPQFKDLIDGIMKWCGF